jgi:hypothetical protein
VVARLAWRSAYFFASLFDWMILVGLHSDRAPALQVPQRSPIPTRGQKNTMIFGIMFSMTATALALRTHDF